MDRYSQSLAKEAVVEYERVAAAYDVTPAQLALKWCYSRPHVASTIIGATSMDQLRENIDAFFLDDLPEGCLDAVADVYSRYRDPSKTSRRFARLTLLVFLDRPAATWAGVDLLLVF